MVEMVSVSTSMSVFRCWYACLMMLDVLVFLSGKWFFDIITPSRALQAKQIKQVPHLCGRHMQRRRSIWSASIAICEEIIALSLKAVLLRG